MNTIGEYMECVVDHNNNIIVKVNGYFVLMISVCSPMCDVIRSIENYSEQSDKSKAHIDRFVLLIIVGA